MSDEVDTLLLTLAKRYLTLRLEQVQGRRVSVTYRNLSHAFGLNNREGDRALRLLAAASTELESHLVAKCQDCDDGRWFMDEVPFPARRTCDYCGEDIEIEEDEVYMEIWIHDVTYALYPLRDQAKALSLALSDQQLTDMAAQVSKLSDELHRMAREADEGRA